MISNAIILAAGSGKRAKSFHTAPKAFIEINGEYIIERSIKLLVKEGVANIHIVIGKPSLLWKQLKAKYPFIKYIQNDNWATSDSFESFQIGMNFVKEDSLILESDIIYSNDVLYDVIHNRNSNVIAVSKESNAGDEFWVVYDNNFNIGAMSKNLDPKISTKAKEFIGVSKVSYHDFTQSSYKLRTYESAILHVSHFKGESVKAQYNRDYIWAEIDNEEQYKHALNISKEMLIHDGRFNIEMDSNKKILLNPGPCTTTRGVKNASLQYDICPREKEFGDVVQEVRQGLVDIVYKTNFPPKKGQKSKFSCCLFTASGTAAVESAIVSNSNFSQKNLILSNGSYGQRIIDIHNAYGIDFHTVNTLDAFIIQLKQDVKWNNVIWVDHETSTGNLNFTPQMAAICKELQPKATVIVDAMSSYAIKQIDMKWGIDFLISSSNKGLGGLPGLSFVICNTAKVKNCSGQFYLDLKENLKHLDRNLGQTLFTPAVFTMYSLRQAIREYKLDVKSKHKVEDNYDFLEELIKSNLDFNILYQEYPSKILMSIELPIWMDFNEYHDYLKDHGITIYPGKDPSYFRLATMGNLIRTDLTKFVRLSVKYQTLKINELKRDLREKTI